MADIVVSDLTKCFDEGGASRDVLRGVSFQVRSGEVVAIIGRSGSGKSTLLNLIAGIDRPSRGSVRIGERDISALNERDRTLFRRASIGFVFQFFNLLPTLTVEENVRLPLELGPKSRGAGREPARMLLQAVGLGDRAHHFPDHLSGGEQQRVAIARALVHAPPLVLADEPTGALDAENGGRILDLLVSLARRDGTTVLLVTHSAEVARAADRTLVVEAGRITASAVGPQADAAAT
jgi:putative ABC transport system ATP-binding protein